MYRIVYTKQAPKDKEKLKASGLDKKAKELIEIVKKIPFKVCLDLKNQLVIYKENVLEELTFNIDLCIK